MSELYESIINGLEEAIEIEKGNLRCRKTIYEILPVKKYDNAQVRAIRNSAGMTQSVFADYMGVSKKTIEAWEKGTNHPTGSACRLLSILEEGKSDILPFVRKSDVMEG